MHTSHRLRSRVLLVVLLYFLAEGPAAGQRDVGSPKERVSILELLAARFEANLSSIKTWSATYELSITAPFPIYDSTTRASTPAVVDELIRTTHSEFTFDLNNIKGLVFLDAIEDPKRVRFVDKNGNVVAYPADYPYVAHHERFLIRDGYRYSLLPQFGRGRLEGFSNDPFEAYPDKVGPVIDQTAYVEFGRLDPRNFFQAPGGIEYAHERLRFLASVFLGQYGEAESEYFARHCKLTELKGDDGQTVIVVTKQYKPKAGAKVGDQSVERYELRRGLPLEYTFHSSKIGKVSTFLAWEYVDDGTVAIPSKFREVSHDPQTGKLQVDAEWVLRKSTLNHVLDETKWDLSRLASEDGIRLANHIDRSVQVWSATDNRFVVGTGGLGVGSPSPKTQMRKDSSSVWLILMGALGMVFITGIVAYRIVSLRRSAK